jgi:hypothetical protein
MHFFGRVNTVTHLMALNAEDDDFNIIANFEGPAELVRESEHCDFLRDRTMLGERELPTTADPMRLPIKPTCEAPHENL